VAKKKDGPSRTRQQLDEAMQKVERDQLLQSARRRLEIAMAGVKANEQHRYVEAVKAYHGYLRILEEVKGCADGGLVPSHFNVDEEMGEILLLVGIYWDLAKIYDHLKSADKYTEFRGYLDKFLLFSRGFPHEGLSKDMLRRYLRREKPKHSREFREAYRQVSKDKCFVAGALVDVIDEETLPRLRAFRERKLSKSAPGRAFIRTYYALGPGLAVATDQLPGPARQLLACLLDRVAELSEAWCRCDRF
jgi:hypothetical protein